MMLVAIAATMMYESSNYVPTQISELDAASEHIYEYPYRSLGCLFPMDPVTSHTPSSRL